ncbi:hypothetical protein BN1723_020660, partial [Verticillium longisporum]
DTVEDAQGL